MVKRREGLSERAVGLMVATLGFAVTAGSVLFAFFAYGSSWSSTEGSVTALFPGYFIATMLGLITLIAGLWLYRRNRS